MSAPATLAALPGTVESDETATEKPVASNPNGPRITPMSKVAILTNHEANAKARAESYLAETQRILKHLAAERRREARRRATRPNILAEVKTILQGA